MVGREFRTIGAQLGYRYDPSPLCIPDGSPPPPDEMETYVPTARPGSRAPHAWLSDGRSTLDLFGRGFTLLRFPGAPEAAALRNAAAERGVPFDEQFIGDEQVAALYERKLVLYGPMVMWHGAATHSQLISERTMAQVAGWE